MAKKDEIKIKINVDGKDITLTKKQAKQLGKELDKTGTSAHSADRRLKGAAQASSNTTKNLPLEQLLDFYKVPRTLEY